MAAVPLPKLPLRAFPPARDRCRHAVEFRRPTFTPKESPALPLFLAARRRDNVISRYLRNSSTGFNLRARRGGIAAEEWPVSSKGIAWK